MRTNWLLVVLTGLLPLLSVAQKAEKITDLPDALQEISGMTFLNDTVLVAHNDSGNEPILFFLNLKGRIIHQLWVRNAKNRDWEDITSDGKGHLYIADIGNNNNAKKKLQIYRISTWNILQKTEVNAEEIEFNYPEQVFPTPESDLHYDAEALAYYKDSLYVFTKCRAEPFDGITYMYSLPVKPGKYVAKRRAVFSLGTGGFLKDAITAAEICGDKCYLLTYNRLIIYQFKNGQLSYLKKIYLKPYTQKEALTTRDNKILYISDEKQKILGGGDLYKLKL
jgi:hypothetical protein